MNLDLIIIIFTSIANLLLGAVVLSRSPNKLNNRIFGLISLSITFWIVFNYLADNAHSYNIIYTRLTYVSIVWVIYCVLSLSQNFPIKSSVSELRLSRLQLPFSILVTILCLSPFFVVGVNVAESGVSLNLSNLYYIFIVYLVQALGLMGYSFYSQYRGVKSAEQKTQIRLLAAGVLLYAIFAIMSNLVLPSLLGSWSSSKYGPIFTLFLVGTTAYSIIWRGLFDIRPVVARSIAYAMSLIAVLFVYSIFAFTLAVSFQGLNITFQQSLFFAGFSAIVALLFQPIKAFFDKVSNKLFYRDAYEPQRVINKINSTLVGSMDLSTQLSRASDIVETELNLSYVGFFISSRPSIEFKIANSNQSLFENSNWQNFRDLFSQSEYKSAIVSDDEIDADLRKFMKELRIEGAIKMVSSGDEVGFLLVGERKSGNAFASQDLQLLEITANSVAIAAQNALRFEEISQFNETLQKKIDDATRQLQRTNEKLKALDEAKDDFISMASHQLRTPLTSVKGYLSMVIEGDAGKITDFQRSMLEQSFNSAERMAFLIADLLNLSRLKSGKFVIENKPTMLPDLIQQELAQLTATAEARGLNLYYEPPQEFPMMMLDETKIRQVIMNFLDNAIYYTPSGGEIIVKLEVKPGSVEYTVKDNGIGVAAADQHNLFTKFYRAANARHARPDGTGLGLFMARKVIVAQGGAIIFKSQLGKGSTFGFSIPRKFEVDLAKQKTTNPKAKA